MGDEVTGGLEAGRIALGGGIAVKVGAGGAGGFKVARKLPSTEFGWIFTLIVMGC